MIKDKTPLEHLEHWWSRVSAEERAAFDANGLDAPARVGVGGSDGGPVTFVDIARRAMADRLEEGDVRRLAEIAGRVGGAT